MKDFFCSNVNLVNTKIKINMVEVGKVESRKISENEFSYSWNFGQRKNLFTCVSPTFGILCSSFSGCCFKFDLRIQTLYCVISFYLQRCNVLSKVSSASLMVLTSDKRSYEVTDRWIVDKCDLQPFQKICEFHLTNIKFVNCEKFIFTLQLKQPKSVISAPELPLLLQENKTHNKSSSSLDNEESKNKPYNDNPKELIQDLRTIYTSGKMCDLEILIGENILRAHKFILCSRSPVFMKMMEHECLEVYSNSITITDCSAIQFKKFLTYLYTGEIEDRSMDTVVALYSLGDKYDVSSLRNACSDLLKNKLSESVDEVANIVCDVLQLAELYNDRKLKDLAVSFIVKHFPVVSNKQSWRDLMKSNQELTSEVLALVVTACQKLKS